MSGSPSRPAKGFGIMHCKRLVAGKKEFSGPYAVHKPTKAANTISVSFCILEIKAQLLQVTVSVQLYNNHNVTSYMYIITR